MKTVVGRQGSAANSGVSGAGKTGHSSGPWSFQQLAQHHMHSMQWTQLLRTAMFEA
jgi:hypothetical protein